MSGVVEELQKKMKKEWKQLQEAANRVMNADVHVNTADILAVAERIEKLNDGLAEKVNGKNSAISRLGSYWHGNAAEKSINTYLDKVKQYEYNRYTVVENYVKFLKSVATGYETTEETNVSLANTFE